VKAWVATNLNGEDGLQLQELPSPTCDSTQIRIAYGMSAIKDPAMNHANFGQLFTWHAEGRLHVHIGDVAGFGELPQACARMYAGSAIGKTVVEIDPRTS
jgi:NADPH-dependent curcumin reductase CurA